MNIMKNILVAILLIFIINGLQAQESAQAAFNEGVKLLKLNKFTKAEKQFSIAIAQGVNPNGLKMSYIYKGFAFNGQGKYDSSIVCFDKAIEIDPLDPASFSDRAKAYSFNMDYENSIKDFQHVLKLDSIGEQAEAAFYYLGQIEMLQFKNEEAINYFNQYINLVPTDAKAYFLRGTAKSNILDYEGSITDYDKAIKYKPNYMEAYANRGVSKVNLIPVSEKIGKKRKCLEEPCADLLKARELGDTTVDDMIFLYCRKCK